MSPKRVLIGFGVDVDAVAGWYASIRISFEEHNKRRLGLVLMEEKTRL